MEQPDDLGGHRSALPYHVEVEVLPVEAHVEAELERRVGFRPCILDVVGGDVTVAVPVEELVLTEDGGLHAGVGVVLDRGVVDVLPGSEASSLETVLPQAVIVGPAVLCAGGSVHDEACSIIVHGSVVLRRSLRLDMEVHRTGDGASSGDVVVEVADAVAVRQGEFHTGGHAGVDVDLGFGDTEDGRGGAGAAAGDAGLHALEHVEGTAELVMPEIPVDTGVHHADVGPGEDGVGHLVVDIALDLASGSEHIGAAGGVAHLISVGAALGHTGLTVGPAELEVADPGEVLLDERLLGDSPAEGIGREEAPSLALLVDIGSVVTAHDLDKVLAGVLIVETAEVAGGGGGHAGSCCGIGACQTAVDRRMGEEVAEQALAGKVAGVHLRRLCGGHRGDVVLADDLVVVGLEADVHALALIHPLAVGVLVAAFSDDLVIMLGIVGVKGIDGLLGVGAVVVEVVRTLQEELEALHEVGIVVEVHRIREGAAALVGVIQVVVHHRDRVLGRGLSLIGVVVRILGDRGRDGTVGEGDVVEDHVGLLVVHVIVGRVGRSGGAEGSLVVHRQVVGQLEGEVAAQGVALVLVVVRRLVDTLVVVEAAGDEVGHRLVTSADGQVVGLGGRMVLHGGVPPAEVLQGSVLGGFDVLVGERTVELRHVSHFVGELDVVGDAHLLRHLRLTEGEHVGIGHGRLLHCGTLLGGDHDDAVAGAEAVDGSRSVLQDGDALDVLRVQLGEFKVGVDALVAVRIAAGADHTVDDDHRGAVAAEAEVGSEGAGSTAGLADEKSRDLAL